jgi:hypothetical protein
MAEMALAKLIEAIPSRKQNWKHRPYCRVLCTSLPEGTDTAAASGLASQMFGRTHLAQQVRFDMLEENLFTAVISWYARRRADIPLRLTMDLMSR